jgi:dipeptidase E
MKLLLTSSGLTSQTLKDKFLELIKDIPDPKILVCITACAVEEDKSYVEKSLEALYSTGVKNITKVDFNDFPVEESKRLLDDADVISIEGGNTFHLLNSLKNLGLDKYLKEKSETDLYRDKIYIGVSAGSIITGPNIGVATIEPADENKCGLKDLTALGLVDFEVSPHCPGVVSLENTEDYAKRTSNEVIAIGNGEGVYVTSMGFNIIRYNL